MNIKINPKKTFYFLLSIIGVLLIANIMGAVAFTKFDIEFSFFYFGSERNIPTYYSSTALLASSILLYFIGKWHKENDPSYLYLYWYGLAIIFLGLALDESISIHENFATPTRRLLRSTGMLSLPSLWWLTSNGYILNTILSLAWVIPYSSIALLIGLTYFKFIKMLPHTIAILFIASGMVYIVGAVGFELISGFEYTIYGEPTIRYYFLLTIEETFEMLGIALFIYALLLYASERVKNINLSIDESPKERRSNSDT